MKQLKARAHGHIKPKDGPLNGARAWSSLVGEQVRASPLSKGVKGPVTDNKWNSTVCFFIFDVWAALGVCQGSMSARHCQDVALLSIVFVLDLNTPPLPLSSPCA
uniref:Uncharacterized protein n=1 Tax=Eutreptiella gymnastica TaxID=73025 RepID=A0A7S4LDY8_9EUGL